MVDNDKDIGFTFDAADGERTKFFNIDGSLARHVDVWVEAFDDKRFWLGYLVANERFKFTMKTPDAAVTTDGVVTNGCDRLFLLEETGVIKLGTTQIFCIDGDDSFLKSYIPGFTSKKLSRENVYSTNIHSIENAFLSPSLLDNVFEAITGCSTRSLCNQPSDVIHTISKTISPVVTMLAFCEAVSRDSPACCAMRKRLNAALQTVRKTEFLGGIEACTFFTSFLEETKSVREEVILELNRLGEWEAYEKYAATLTTAGFGDNHAYLFARGHSIYKGVIDMLGRVTELYRVEEEARLIKKHSKSDDLVRGLNKNWLNFDIALKTSFYAQRPAVPFLAATCDRLKQDYA